MSDFTDLIESAYNEMVALVGVPITFESTTKQCIAGPLKLGSAFEIVGSVAESSIQVTMLAADFDEFDVVPNVTECTIDDAVMTITEIERDPQDPTVQFRAIGEH